jgi:hypothetical protein
METYAINSILNIGVEKKIIYKEWAVRNQSKKGSFIIKAA